MNDLPLTAASAWGDASQPAATPNLPEYTVSELSLALKRAIEDGFGFVRVRGEVSGWKRHASGHCYFALKDSDAVIDAVCWRMTAIRLDLKPEDGMEVVCSGRLTTYAGRSKYQLDRRPHRAGRHRRTPEAARGTPARGSRPRGCSPPSARRSCRSCPR